MLPKAQSERDLPLTSHVTIQDLSCKRWLVRIGWEVIEWKRGGMRRRNKVDSSIPLGLEGWKQLPQWVRGTESADAGENPGVMYGRGTLLVCRPGPSKGLMSLGDRKYQGSWNHVEAEEQTIPRGQGEGSGTVGKTRTTVWCADDNGLNASQLVIIHSLNNPGASDGGCHM